jgi:hypothetical protein
MSEYQQPPNLAFYVPYGELLRTFLEQSFVTEKDLRDLLRKRGVFLDQYTKEKAIPHLALATVTPREFEILLGLQKTKLDSAKTVTETVEWSSERTVIAAIQEFPDTVDVGKIFEKSLSVKVTNLSAPQVVENNPNRVRYDFDIEKSTLHQGWHVDKTPHPGSVEIQKTGEGKQAMIEITSTIPETKVVGKRIVKDIQEKLTITGDIPPKAKRSNIQFSSFENAERIRFFLSLTDTGSREIVFAAITDSSVFPDLSKQLPDEIERYFKKVDRVTLGGDELQGSMFLAEEEYRSYILLSRMVVKYDIDYHGGKGACTVEYKFEGYPKTKAAHDFVTNPITFNWDEARTPNKAAAQRYVESKIREIVREKSQPYFTEVREDEPSIRVSRLPRPRRARSGVRARRTR